MGDIVNLSASATRKSLLESGFKPLDAADWVAQADRKAALSELCAKSGIANAASLVWIEAEHLFHAAVRLIGYLTLKFPALDATSSVVSDAIVEAVRAYKAASQGPGSTAGEIAFLTQLCACADHILAWQVIAIGAVDGRMKCWDAWQCSLPDWLRQGRHEEFFVRRRDLRTDVELLGARTALAAKLVSHRELGMLEMHRRRSSRSDA